MALLINLRLLEAGPVRLNGELTPAELDLTDLDELIRLEGPVRHELEAAKIENGVLVTGQIGLTLHCECARCLKPFTRRLEMANWTCHLALEGEETVPVANDCVDLTPSIREDILLELPQRPLCQPECQGLPKPAAGKKKTKTTAAAGQDKGTVSAWAALNKLKF